MPLDQPDQRVEGGQLGREAGELYIELFPDHSRDEKVGQRGGALGGQEGPGLDGPPHCAQGVVRLPHEGSGGRYTGVAGVPGVHVLVEGHPGHASHLVPTCPCRSTWIP